MTVKLSISMALSLRIVLRHMTHEQLCRQAVHGLILLLRYVFQHLFVILVLDALFMLETFIQSSVEHEKACNLAILLFYFFNGAAV